MPIHYPNVGRQSIVRRLSTLLGQAFVPGFHLAANWKIRIGALLQVLEVLIFLGFTHFCGQRH